VPQNQENQQKKEQKKRKSISITETEEVFYDEYSDRKGIRGGFAGLVSIALHSYVARNKLKGVVPPWETPGKNTVKPKGEATNEQHGAGGEELPPHRAKRQ